MTTNTNPFEFYETPHPFTHWLFRGVSIVGRTTEVCCGSGAIIEAAQSLPDADHREWVANDIDPRWPAQSHEDAALPALYEDIGARGLGVDWIVTNPPFSEAPAIIAQALRFARVGVAMHLRASIHEPLKRGPRRSLLRDHPPAGILWLPRFAYQRSQKTGEWATDSVTSCWVIWSANQVMPQFIDYAPAWVLDDLRTYTPIHRARMDRLMPAPVLIEEQHDHPDRDVVDQLRGVTP